MGHRRSGLYYILVVATTALVVVVPALVVYALRVNGVVTNFWACLGLSAGLALVASFGASALWRRHRLLPETVFSDLLVWGSLRRAYTERQISRALASLDRLGSTASAEERARFLKKLAVALDARDPYLHNHSRRVARHAAGTARRMSLHGSEVAVIETAALLHDVGKLNTPPEILEKEGSLTDAERAVMREHVNEGAELVETLDDPRLTAIVRHHHERFDGGGYPSGLAGERIPLGGRVVAVADTFDAITSARPYRDGMEDKQGIDILREEEGRQLDPDAVHAFIRYYSDRDLSAFFSALLHSLSRTDFLRSLQSALVSVLAAGSVAIAAVAASSPALPTAAAATEVSANRNSVPPRTAPTPSASSTTDPQANTISAKAAARHARATSSSSSTTTAPTTRTATSTTSTSTPIRPPAPPSKSSPAPAKPLPCQPNCEPAITAPTETAPTTTVTTPETTTSTSTTTKPSTTETTGTSPAETASTTTTEPSTTETTSTSTTETTSTGTTETTSTTPTDPCEDWAALGYKNHGECVADQHRH